MHMRERLDLAVVTNDIYTHEDQRLLTEAGALAPERIIGVEPGGCPRTAICEDASIHLEAVDRMLERFPQADVMTGSGLSPDAPADCADAMSRPTCGIDWNWCRV